MAGPVVSLLALHSLQTSVQYIRQRFFRWKAPRPDFSTLPRVPWVIILSNLDIEDRYAISQTCQELQHIYLTESCLSRSIVIILGGAKSGNDMKKELTPAEKALLTSGARGVQTVEFVLRPFVLYDVSRATLATITEVSGEWRLKTLEIGSGLHGSERCVDYRVPCVLPAYMEQFFTKFLTSPATETLEVFNLNEWRWRDKMEMPALLSILSQVRFTHSLRRLKLGFTGLADIRYFLIFDTSYDTFTGAVTRFVNLQMLDIPSVYIGADFLLALSQTRHVPLEKLVIEGARFYDVIQPSSWLQLLASCPDLEVHFRISIGPGFDCSDLTDNFPHFVPVTKVYLNNSQQNIRLDGEKQYNALADIARPFSKHLKALSYCEELCQENTTRDPGERLWVVVLQCSSLTQLSFDGRVHSDTILQLAALPRNWTIFEFYFDSIIFDFNRTEERLCREVSRHLQRTWCLSKSRWRDEEDSRLIKIKKHTLSVRKFKPVVRI